MITAKEKRPCRNAKPFKNIQSREKKREEQKRKKQAPTRLCPLGLAIKLSTNPGKEETKMPGYYQRVYTAGNLKVVEKYYSTIRGMKGITRGVKSEKTPERVAEINEKNAVKHLWLTLNENFAPGDLLLTLTYRKDKRPTQEQAKRDMSDYLRKVRAVYKRAGMECRYIWVCEFKSKALHFHLVLPRVDVGKLAELWPHGMTRPEYLYKEGNFYPLAEYLIKETRKTFRESKVSGRRWNSSKNLRKYKVSVEETGRRTWKKEPMLPKNYRLVGEVFNGYHDFSGMPYQTYTLERLETSQRGRRKRE